MWYNTAMTRKVQRVPIVAAADAETLAAIHQELSDLKPRASSAAFDDDRVTLRVLDALGAFGLSAETFGGWLEAANGRDITLLVNSPGGSVFEGRAMANMLRSYRGTVTTEVVGIAASAAVSLLAASDDVAAHRSATVMVHEPAMLTMGGAAHMRKQAEFLDELTHSTAEEYVEYTGMAYDDVREMLAKETFMSAESALEHGFVRRIIDKDDDDAEMRTVAEPELRAMVALAEMLSITTEDV